MTANPESAIIVAGGSGSRMQSNLPKQFLTVTGQPILMHTIRRFYNYNPEIELVIVLPQNQIALWEALCAQHAFEIKHQVVAGGNTRFQSVKNGLAAVLQTGVVAVHDGVRPFVSEKIIADAFQVAGEKGNAVVSVALKDSIREVQGETNQAVDRSHFRLIQTPQCFEFALLKKAYELPEENTFTDDASVVEKLGININLTEGSYENIKITTPEDLLWAEVLHQKRQGFKLQK
ncbi:2-C-methyl-D-erythritol 4-phosphate cytidylyltransferase [Adhaeribacter sp. BT258]|uniref:2-C-methyl-D-erythritol 4-phosphate cytidylyltransferase n=2 Tax=Adhaeribacter terrigena TaxID=2793070 RepID=A0ABS1C194_9BACT|nr:2-C-methyl-D-erythritol 4-phosphate cytidylyltransferase [Adhaeribacter terrigena]MBK0403171.1 2-C-methyl-D-erythritol 4-phosphate cytidylyltransferase [Adhaeribacter terrigena]